MSERKHFLDWLRVIAFGFLILFHVGLLYSPWHYNLKSPRLVEGIAFALNALSPWRLALLFFISGVACRFLIEKLGPGAFAWDRLRRLGTVILFGMLVVVPPQTYVELFHRGLVTTGYLEFWLTSYLPGDPYPGKILPTWDHLWFLVYLLPYTLLLALAVRFAPTSLTRWAAGWRIGSLVVLPGLCLCVTNVLVAELQPVTHELVNDWAAHLRWLSMFGAGLLCAHRTDFWETLSSRRMMLAALCVAFLLLQLGGSTWRGAEGTAVNGLRLWDPLTRGLYGWTMILTLSGFAMRFLDRPSALLSGLNVAILPIYVLHQPILLIAAYFLFPLELPIAIEIATLALVTAGGSFLIYELAIRRFDNVRFAFGLRRQADLTSRAGRGGGHRPGQRETG